MEGVEEGEDEEDEEVASDENVTDDNPTQQRQPRRGRGRRSDAFDPDYSDVAELTSIGDPAVLSR